MAGSICDLFSLKWVFEQPRAALSIAVHRVRSADVEATAGAGATSLRFPSGDFDHLCKAVNCSKLHHCPLQNKEVRG